MTSPSIEKDFCNDRSVSSQESAILNLSAAKKYNMRACKTARRKTHKGR
jgi:hypothetical protein